jgi:hypothetical protein
LSEINNLHVINAGRVYPAYRFTLNPARSSVLRRSLYRVREFYGKG